MHGKRILLIISGGIAAYKCLELIRRLRDRGVSVRVVLTRAAQQFVTPLSVSTLSENAAFTDLFDLTQESEIGHIRLSREADLVVVAPASADLMARMANGLADDLASAVLLATNKPVLIAPAMNPYMWRHPATRRNRDRLAADGIEMIGPNAGAMAERGEEGPGRMAEPAEILERIETLVSGTGFALAGHHVLVTSGPTHEPIDPVRYVANRSSGKQGHAIARAAVEAGARVTLVSGPVDLEAPAGAEMVHVETARQMLEAVDAALPASCGIFAAAVADWRPDAVLDQKIKKTAEQRTPKLLLVENPDILATVSGRQNLRPGLVVGFAAETDNVIGHAREKRQRKGCDWIVANDVSVDGEVAGGVMGRDRNRVHLVTESGVESWPEMSKAEVARALVARIAQELGAAESP